MDHAYFFRPILAHWPTLAELAADIGEEYVNVQQWHYHDRIPAAHYSAIAKAAKRRGKTAPDKASANQFKAVTVERLADLARRRAVYMAKKRKKAA